MIIDGENKAYKLKGELFHCGTAISMNLIGGKWKSIILWYMRNGKIRFSEIKRKIPDITEKTLSLQLKALAKDKLITRKVYGRKPPLKVEYQLSKLGESLIPVISEITKWGINHGLKNGKIINLEKS